MKVFPSKSLSGNQKSQIQKLKWMRIFTIAFTVIFGGAVALAQQPAKLPRIGFISSGDAASSSARAEGIRLGLRELGYIDGQNLAIEYRYGEGKNDRLPELAAELVRLKVDIILVQGGTPAVRAAKNATKTIPIVMVGSGSDPVEGLVVETLARPGGNVTGLTNLTRELGGKRLELFQEAVPKVTRIAVFHGTASPATARELKNVQAAAHTLGLTIQSWEIGAADGFEKVFASLNKQRPDGLYVFDSPLLNVSRKRTVGFALKSKLPSMYQGREAIEAGGLMYYGADLADSNRRVASYVDKLLKGAKPADLPVEQPTKFELFINLKTATQIGLTIPNSVLAKTDRVIK